METKGSLPHLQVPTSFPCPHPDQSSPCLPTPHLEPSLNMVSKELQYI